MATKNYRDESKKNWAKNYNADEAPSHGDLQLGAILRIADATEAIAKNYNQLLSENEYLKKRKKYLEEQNEKLHRSISAYKGQITKLKK